MDRSYFPVTVSGGTAYAVSTPPIQGEIKQLRWHHAVDTGQIAVIELAVLPDQADTGLGWQVYARASANVAAAFVVAPRQAAHDHLGLDTGVDFYVPIALAGDRLGLRVTPADTGVVIDAKLYIWHG